MTLAIANTDETERVAEPVEAGLPEAKPQPLRVLFATDGSEPVDAAGRFLALIPLPAGSALQVVTVLDAPSWQVPESLKGAELEWARRVVDEAGTALSRHEVQFSRRIVRGAPAFEILKAADDFNADLIVVGSHGRTGVERFLLGSVAQNVARHSVRPVLVVRAPSQRLRRVLLAVDSSEHAQHAVRFAGSLCLPADTEVTVCHVVRPYFPVMGPEYLPDQDLIIAETQFQQQIAAEQLVKAAATHLEQCGKHTAVAVLHGDPAGEILRLAEEQCADLVIVGARGVSAIQALLVGSVANRLLKKAPGAVLLVH